MRRFNLLRAVRENWFFFCTVALLGVDITGLIIFARTLNERRRLMVKYEGFSSNYGSIRDFRICVIIISRCSVSLANELFLITYGFLYTNTIVGTFLFQQWIYYPLIIGFTALGCWFGRPFHPMGVYIEWSQLTVPLGIRGACDLLITTVLWCLLLRTKDFKDRKPNCLTANIEELASGTRPIPRNIVTWTGIQRRRGMKSIRARLPKLIRSLAYNALFRRIRPVETKRQVIFQHLFSLAAMALLIVRTVTELHKASDNLPSRTLVGSCRETFNPDNDRSLYIRLPHLKGILNSTQPDTSPYVINVTAAYRCNVNVNAPSRICSQNIASTLPDKSRLVDWYLMYQCPSSIVGRGGISMRQNTCSLAGHQFSIQFQEMGNRTSGATDADPVLNNRLPSIWLVDSNPGKTMLTPYLTPPMEPKPGWNTVFDTHVAQRKFVVSSALWDAVMGSDPTYETIMFFPGSQHITELNQPSNLTTVATGFIHSPKYLDASGETPRDLFGQGSRGPDNLCHTIEEYRVTSSFDMLASIGGLLALLQGIHVFIFGRPLFWGMFGAKIISPFGLVGQFATKGFKQRLQERYHFPSGSHVGGRESNMTQFLLDYVLDMGPASPAQREHVDPESSSDDEVQYTRIRLREAPYFEPDEFKG